MEREPVIKSPLDVAERQLPVNVKLYVSYERMAKNPRLDEQAKAQYEGCAQRIFDNLFSQMDAQALSEFQQQVTAYRTAHTTVVQDFNMGVHL